MSSARRSFLANEFSRFLLPMSYVGGQMGWVLVMSYEKVVVDCLVAGDVLLIKALQPLVEIAKTILELDKTCHAQMIILIIYYPGESLTSELFHQDN